MDLDWHGASQLWDHVLHELNNLQVVLQLVDVRLHLVNGLALLCHKLLVILDVLLDGVKEQVHGLFLLCLDGGDVFGKGLYVLGLVDLDSVVPALLDQVLDASLGLVTQLDAGCIG